MVGEFPGIEYQLARYLKLIAETEQVCANEPTV